jgi:hypothetical protein
MQSRLSAQPALIDHPELQSTQALIAVSVDGER